MRAMATPRTGTLASMMLQPVPTRYASAKPGGVKLGPPRPLKPGERLYEDDHGWDSSKADRTTLPRDSAAIRKYQRHHRLPQTGKADSATRKKMRETNTHLAPKYVPSPNARHA